MPFSCRFRASVSLIVICLSLPLTSASAFWSPDDGESVAKASRLRRLPPHFGKLKLKPEQIEEIYDIRENYGEKLAKLQQQIDELRAQQAADVKDVLTKTQQTELKKLQAANSKPSGKTPPAKKSPAKKSGSKKSRSTSKKGATAASKDDAESMP